LNEFRHSDEFHKQCENEGVKGAATVVFASKMAGRKWGVMSPEEKQVSGFGSGMLFFWCPRELESLTVRFDAYHPRLTRTRQRLNEKPTKLGKPSTGTPDTART
jgi:hypothetical protein